MLTPRQAATMLGVTVEKLWHMRLANNGPAHFRFSPGGRVPSLGRPKYLRSDVEQYMEALRQEAMVLMSREEAAAAMGCTTQLLERRRRDPAFPECIQIGHGTHARIRYRREDVERWVKPKQG
jgi:hypothetical protein